MVNQIREICRYENFLTKMEDFHPSVFFTRSCTSEDSLPDARISDIYICIYIYSSEIFFKKLRCEISQLFYNKFFYEKWIYVKRSSLSLGYILL